jgi:hypothetical protein
MPSEHSHNMKKQLSAELTFEFRWTSSHQMWFKIETRNLLGGRPSPHIRWDSKQTMLVQSIVGKSKVVGV